MSVLSSVVMRRSASIWVVQRQADKTCLLRRSLQWILAAVILITLIGGCVALAIVFDPSPERDGTSTPGSTSTRPTPEESGIISHL